MSVPLALLSLPGPATGGEVDAACIQFDLGGGKQFPPPDLAAL